MAIPTESPRPIAEPARAPAAPPPFSEEWAIQWWNRNLSPPPLREIVAVLLWVVLADATIYWGQGYAGLAAVTCAAPLLLALGSPVARLGRGWLLLAGLTWLLGARMLWLGSVLQVVLGVLLTGSVAMSLIGRRVRALDPLLAIVQTVPSGCLGLVRYGLMAARSKWPLRRVLGLSVFLPLGALVLFSLLFVFANPDLLESLRSQIFLFWQQLQPWFQHYAPNVSEIFFWVASAWFFVGLLRPLLKGSTSDGSKAPRGDRKTAPATAPGEAAVGRLFDPALSAESGKDLAANDEPGNSAASKRGSLFRPLRNMLLAVIGLFAVYLVFEFQTLWFREFPEKFYYAGYAHEGAAWLTVALGVATLILSFTFRGGVLDDAGLTLLKRLAWIWSAENFLLALAVYNRLFIYIDFNGMTRMRMIGLFGISTVVLGFGLVVWKIIHNRGFVWLVRGQLLVLALAVYLYQLTPVDLIVQRFNVRHILAGDLPPAVQIGYHDIDSQGLIALEPLVRCDDTKIRDGVRALFAREVLRLEEQARHRTSAGWTARQLADEQALKTLLACESDWTPFRDSPGMRDRAWADFTNYVYQWY